MRRWAFSIALLAAIGAAPAPEGTAMKHAAGTFEVVITPEAQDAPAGGMPTSRMGIVKTFSGGMAGTATGTMLAAGTPKPGQAAGYVAIDQFRGIVDGHAGGFLLLHRGTMTKAGGSDLSVIIAPDSGTGALEGITGTFTIEIKDDKHLYDLAYRLPAGR
ncbi:DUF3224 domain-containing protein [Sphingomonas endolithica]|uniref:DUF3224 domain-containing protein n=1 Tax=Sphingomonas endolithica TaxID=2972485 RepID=UPI0021AFB661|nr:DUF3224 domain-containing protein [Sphingomonas sp. ZFBP2030]